MITPKPVWTFFSILLIVTALGCGNDETARGNDAPIIAEFEAESEVVLPGTQVPIQLKAIDYNNDILTYSWSANYGDIEGDANGAIWTAPEAEQKYHIQVTVSDGEKTTTSTLDIVVFLGREGNYYPLAEGNLWRYRNAQGIIITFEVIDTIQIQLEDGETLDSFVLQKSSNEQGTENIVNYTYLGHSYDENGEVSGIIQHAQNITSGTEDTMTFTPYLPLYQFPLYPCKKWEVRFEAELVPELFPLGRGTDKFEVLSIETVTVPAGTYDDVFQVQESFTWGMDFDTAKITLDTTVTKKWLAPNIGLIKFTQTQIRNDVPVESEFELESYELVSNSR